MKEKLIKLYINKLTKEDILTFAKKQGIYLTKYELEYIYTSIKTKADIILNNPSLILNEANKELSNNTYKKLYELYTIYYPKLYH